MAEIKKIDENETFTLGGGDLTITANGGDAHHTAISILLNDFPIAAGAEEVEKTLAAGTFTAGDQLYIEGRIDKPSGSSSWASLSITFKDDTAPVDYNYSQQEPDYEVVQYQVTITLKNP